VEALSGRAIIDNMSRAAVPALAATVALALLAAGCGGASGNRVAQLGSSTTQDSASAGAPSAPAQTNDPVAFARCMRAHGVPAYPDPASGGQLVKKTPEQLGVSLPRFQAAQGDCRNLLPNGGSGPTQAQLQAERAQALDYAWCVRAHGVPNFPDPDSTGRIPDPATVGINQGSPKFEAANQACGRYRPPYMPSNAGYNAWVRTHGS